MATRKPFRKFARNMSTVPARVFRVAFARFQESMGTLPVKWKAAITAICIVTVMLAWVALNHLLQHDLSIVKTVNEFDRFNSFPAEMTRISLADLGKAIATFCGMLVINCVWCPKK